jgi:tight adherence protein B
VSGLIGCLVGLSVLLGGRWTTLRRRERVLRRIEPPSNGEVRRQDRRWPPFPRRSASVLAGAVLGVAIAGSVGLALGAACAAILVEGSARRRSKRATALRDEQLADAVRSITAALRAGLSVAQSLAYAANEAEQPLRASLHELVDGLDLGVPLDDALASWSALVDSEDARLLSGVLRLHRRSGGDLPTVLDHVATTLSERRAAAREIRALTSQARLSGAILGLLPIGFFAFLWLTSRRDIEGAFRSPAGLAAIAVGLTMEGLAFVWIRRLLEVR